MMRESATRLRDDAAGTFAFAAIGVWRHLSPLHLVAAIAIGIVAVVFQALTYAVSPEASPQLLVDYSGLFAAIAACVALDRARHRAGAWAVLAIAYVFVFLTVAHHSSGRELIIGQIMAHCLVLAVFVADRVVPPGSSGRLAYIAAAIAGIATGALVWAAVLTFGTNLFTDDVWAAEASSPFFLVLHPVYVAMFWLLFGGAAVLFYGERRLAARALQRLRHSELERVRRSREMIESRLQATQARVEPQFLFNTLAHVRRSHSHDPVFAERMLDELVSFLRAAMPRLRDTSSVLEQEAELVRAYLDILRMNIGTRLEFAIEVSNHAAQARLPSMLLLPLIDLVVTHGLRPGSGESRLRIAAAVENGRLGVRVVNRLGAMVEIADGGAIAVLRERVAALYGEGASLKVTATPGGGIEAALEIPYERAR